MDPSSRNSVMDNTFLDSENISSHYPSKTNSRNRGTEPKIKLKKLRSIKLSGLPSLKSFKRRSVFQHDDNLADTLFTNEPTFEQSTTTDVSDDLSNYADSTISFSRTMDSMQKPVQTLTGRSKLKLGKPRIPKSCEGPEKGRRRTQLRSTKFTDSGSSTGDTKCQDDQESLSSKSASSFSGNKTESQASPTDFDFSSSSGDPHMMYLHSSATSSTTRKTARKLARKSSMKPDRIFASMITKKAALRKTKTSEHPHSNIVRATCSSILKNSKVPNEQNLEALETVCEEFSTGKVCTYSYCSLHGNRKATAPSLKRFSSMKRQRRMNQKSFRSESSKLPREKFPVSVNQTRGKESKQDCLINETKDTGTKASDDIQKIGSDFTVETCARPKGQTKEIGIQTEDIDFSDNENPVRNSLSQISNISTTESKSLVTPPILIDNSMEVSCLGMKLDEALTEAAGTDQEEKHIVTFSPGKKYKSNLPCDKLAPTDHFLSASENLSSLAMLCLDPSDAVRQCSGEVPVGGKALLRAKSSSTDTESDNYCSGLTRSLLQTNFNKAPNNSGNLKIRESVAAKPSTPRVDTKSICDPLEEAASVKEDKGIESKLGSSQKHSTIEVPDTNSRVYVAHMQFVKSKNNSLWNLIYQNTASQLPTTDETNLQTEDEEDIGRKGKNRTMMHVEKNVLLSQRDSGAVQSAGEDDEDAGLHKVELTQSDAIKLVQEAINNILLLEVQGHTSDNHSTTSNIPAHPNLQEVNQEKCLEPPVSTSDILVKEMYVDGRTSNMMAKKPTRQLSKSWSSVRKIFLLRRFVKTLERMRNCGPQTPRHLPLELNHGSEKVHLRCQTSDGKRNAEEWMLDYALQQVISKLAPAQKKRVELLVKAYESMVPPTETESNWDTTAAPSSDTDSVQLCNDSAVKTSGEIVETTNNESFPNTLLREKENSACDTSNKNVSYFGVIRSARDKEIPLQEKVILEVPIDIVSTSGKETKEAAVKSIRSIGGNSVKTTETRMPISSGSVHDGNGNGASITNTIRKAGPEIISLQEHPGSKKHTQSYIHTSNAIDDEKKEQMKLWFMVYRRMLSGLSVEESTEKLLNDEEEKQVDEEIQPYQEEAIKLVEEAIDGIVLTDSEDQLSDNQSVSSYAASDQELHDDKQSEEDFFVSASAGDRFRESDKVNQKPSVVSNIEGTWKNSRDKSPQQQEKPMPKLGSKFNRKTSSHWSKVRKLMRFITALDKVKKINPRQPRHLPSEAEPEAETVDLKHQEGDSRKNSEEWMLDYAMQHAVARLTPARKRKVQLLVEAFETVMPTIKTEAR